MAALPDPVRLLLADHHGLATLATLGALGVGPRSVCRWADGLLLERLLPGVFRDPQAPVPDEQPLALATTYLDHHAQHPGACITGAGALALHGAEGFPLACRPVALVSPGRRVRLADAPFDLRRAQVPAAQRRTVRGIATVELHRALADAAADDRAPDRDLRVGFDSLRWAGRTRVHVLAEALAALPGRHPGRNRLERMIAEGVLDLESEGERRTHEVFQAHPPVPAVQRWVLARVRVDFLFLSAALVLEYLGGLIHVGQLEQDSERIWVLRQAGYEVLPVTAAMVRRPEVLAARVHAIRREREALVAADRVRVPPLPPQPPR